AGAAIPAISDLGFHREANRTDIDPIFERVVQDTVLGIAATAVGTLEGDHRPGVRTGQRIIVDDQVRAQRARTAEGHRAIYWGADTGIGHVVEHLAGFGQIAERVLRCKVRYSVVLHDGSDAVGIV